MLDKHIVQTQSGQANCVKNKSWDEQIFWPLKIMARITCSLYRLLHSLVMYSNYLVCTVLTNPRQIRIHNTYNTHNAGEIHGTKGQTSDSSCPKLYCTHQIILCWLTLCKIILSNHSWWWNLCFILSCHLCWTIGTAYCPTIHADGAFVQIYCLAIYALLSHWHSIVSNNSCWWSLCPNIVSCHLCFAEPLAQHNLQ